MNKQGGSSKKFGVVVPVMTTLGAMLLLTTSSTFAQEKQPLATDRLTSNSIDQGVLIAQSSLEPTSPVPVENKNVNTNQVRPLSQGGSTNGPNARNLSGNGFTYRHDWGLVNGDWILNLNWAAINNNSRVFVAISECNPDTSKFMGSARYTLYNVVPRNGVVSIRANIDWASPIRLCADYLVVNP